MSTEHATLMHAPIAPSGGIGQPRPPQENVPTKRKRKIKKKRQTKPNPDRKKAFNEKRDQLAAARKERKKKNTCRLTTEETCKPWKILEIALAKKLQRPTQTSREFS